MNNPEEYVLSEPFRRNLEQQNQDFESYLHQLMFDKKNPFDDWRGFVFHYYHFRAAIASLRKNPDTKNDPVFVQLCETWKGQRFGSIDFSGLEKLFNELRKNPVFDKNYLLNEAYGSFIKSVYMLFQDEYYTHSFFEVD
jgi:hypothetical protein